MTRTRTTSGNWLDDGVSRGGDITGPWVKPKAPSTPEQKSLIIRLKGTLNTLIDAGMYGQAQDVIAEIERLSEEHG